MGTAFLVYLGTVVLHLWSEVGRLENRGPKKHREVQGWGYPLPVGESQAVEKAALAPAEERAHDR